MPRTPKLDTFFAYAPKNRGHHEGEIFLGVTGVREASIQDLFDFLKEKGIDPRKVPLPRHFMIYTIKPD